MTRRWRYAYTALAIASGLALMSGACGRGWVGLGLALLTFGVAVLVASSLDLHNAD